jgi:hypothetical protein
MARPDPLYVGTPGLTAYGRIVLSHLETKQLLCLEDPAREPPCHGESPSRSDSCPGNSHLSGPQRFKLSAYRSRVERCTELAGDGADQAYSC